jgi:hypothetical protein
MSRLSMAFVLAAMVGGNGFAATPRCVEAPDPVDAGVRVLRCESGLVIFAETTAIRSSAALMSAHRHAIQLDDGALLVVAPASAAPFAALTPDAVASGEGVGIVVAQNGGALVEPIRGRVVLRRRMDNAETVFGEGAHVAGAILADGRFERLREAWRRWRGGR